MPFQDYETVVGLECHVQLDTATKLFSPAKNNYGDAPNTNVDVVDLGLPGVLPVLNEEAVNFAIRLGHALGCTIHPVSEFSRKHYFYPDLPKGYQISQFDKPICTGGSLDIEVDGVTKTIGITRIHIEEDAGKNIHVEGGASSYCDYNRAGTPLLEVVSEPDFRSADEAEAYYRKLRQICMYLKICDGNLQEGSMRADANVSVRKYGAPEFGQRTETKNINSPKYLNQAIVFESNRQVLEVEAGNTIRQETRLWDPNRKESRAMRTKEDADDYRYFPCPDLLPLHVEQKKIDRIREELPELADAKHHRFVQELGVSDEAAHVLVSEASIANYFEAALKVHGNAKGVSNWVINEVLRVAKERSEDSADISNVNIPAAMIGELVQLIDERVISGKIAKKVFAELEASVELSPSQIVESKGWRVERDDSKIEAIIDQVMNANPDEVTRYQEGKTKLFGFFVGQVMKETRGQADPADVNRLLKTKLDVN